MYDTVQRCQDESSSNVCSGKRLFPCLYHCKKMLCIRHLSEHEQTSEERIEIQEALRQCWNIYSSNFNEFEVIRQIENQKKKLREYQSLKTFVTHLLSMSHSQVLTIDQTIFHDVLRKIHDGIRMTNPPPMISGRFF